MSKPTPAINPEDCTILVIDDTPFNLKVIAEFLSQAGFRVLVARNGASGLARAVHGSPDLILLDVLMPGMDGFECCRQLKADPQTQDIPVIFMTALSEERDKVEGFKAGAVDYIIKPLQQEELFARVNTHLAISKLTASLEQKVVERTQALNEALLREQQLAAELKQALAAEQEVSRFRSQIIEVVSHEFRTPITVINQANYLLEHHYEQMDAEKRIDVHGRINHQVRSVEKMLNDVVLVYEGVLNAEQLNFVPVPFDALCRELEQRLNGQFANDPRLQYNVMPSSEMVVTDLNILADILVHLVANGLKFAEAPTPVHLSFCLEGDQLKIDIIDSGIGVPEDERSQIFDLFYRAANVNARRGLGIGLYLANLYVGQLGGEISLNGDESSGQTIFTLTQPRMRNEN